MLRFSAACIAIFCLFSDSTLAQTTWTLQSCIDHAFEHNLQIKQSQLSGERAELNYLSAQGAFLPSLNASASHGYNIGRAIDPFSNDFLENAAIQSNNLGLNSGITLFNGFKNHLNLRRSRIGLDLAATNLEQTKNDLALTISGAYLNILFQDEFINVAILNLETTRRQVERVAKLVEAGASPAADLLDVRAQEASDAASLISSENARFLAKLNLVQLLQLSGDKAIGFEIVVPAAGDLEVSPIPLSANSAVSFALTNFPQVRAAELNVQDANLGLDIAKTARLPRIFGSYNFGSGYSNSRMEGDVDPIETDYSIMTVEGVPLGTTVYDYSGVTLSTIPFSDQLNINVNQSVFFSLSIPIFNGFSVKNSVEQARVSVLQSQYAQESANQVLRASIESAWADANAAQKTLIAQEAALTAAELAFANTELRFEAGTISALEYADARTRLDNAKIGALRTRYDLVFKSKILDFYRGKAITLR